MDVFINTAPVIANELIACGGIATAVSLLMLFLIVTSEDTSGGIREAAIAAAIVTIVFALFTGCSLIANVNESDDREKKASYEVVQSYEINDANGRTQINRAILDVLHGNKKSMRSFSMTEPTENELITTTITIYATPVDGIDGGVHVELYEKTNGASTRMTPTGTNSDTVNTNE